jgi:hypothetical protein
LGPIHCSTKNIRDKQHFNYNDYNFRRVSVTGQMTSSNIIKACAAKGLKPICDHPSYADGACVVAQHNSDFHFS